VVQGLYMLFFVPYQQMLPDLSCCFSAMWLVDGCEFQYWFTCKHSKCQSTLAALVAAKYFADIV